MIGLLDDVADLWRMWRARSDPEGLAFDARFGTETRWFDLIGNYEPCSPALIGTVLDALDVDPCRYGFVDLGCGKGRALIVAARRPFVRVLGIEHRSALSALARRNLQRAEQREPACCPVEVRTGDAAREPLPEGPLVLFLYNPFGAEIMRAVLSRVRCPEARLAYVNPVEQPTVEALGWVLLRQGGADEDRWRIYRPG